LLRLSRQRGPVVGINWRPRLIPSASPNFAEMFYWEAKRQGRKVVDWKRSRPDVLLIISKTVHQELLDEYRRRGVPVVLRLDGVGVKDPTDPKKGNINYLTAQKADFIIYQSGFCQRIWERLFSLNKPSRVIYNGADERIFSPEGERLKRSDTGFVIVGDTREAGVKIPDHPQIITTGRLSHKKMARVFRSGDIFLYLPWYEWCPKVVVQALVCGLPVVNTLLEQGKKIPPRPDLYLSTMIRKYFEVFEKVLGG